MTATVTLNTLPAGYAIDVTAQATARDLAQPVVATSGALVDEQTTDTPAMPAPPETATPTAEPPLVEEVLLPIDPPADDIRDPIETVDETGREESLQPLEATATAEFDQTDVPGIADPAPTQVISATLPILPDIQPTTVPAPTIATTATLPVTDTLATRFVPGQPALLQSSRKWLEVQVPANAAGQPLTLEYRLPDAVAPELRARGESVPPSFANGRRGFGTFFLEATTDQGQDVHQFDAPLTLVYHYTPQQLRAIGASPANLTFFWFDPNVIVTNEEGQTIQGVGSRFPALLILLLRRSQHKQTISVPSGWGMGSPLIRPISRRFRAGKRDTLPVARSSLIRLIFL
ncbi:hypothetical protein HC891_17120 [Candidatus Gracilibacteria bacterium]|nr:hypothetical protein [Candidatus Gracilibacteria bacterium]